MCEEGSTGITATRFFFLINFMPKFSINVDFPAPGDKMKFINIENDLKIEMRGNGPAGCVGLFFFKNTYRGGFCLYEFTRRLLTGHY